MTTTPPADPQRCIRRAGSRWSKCPCTDCRDARNRMEKLRRFHGSVPRIPWQDGWRAFTQYIDRGWSPTAIADACNVDERTLAAALIQYRAGGTRRFNHGTCARLLNPARRPTTGYIGATGSMRRLQALAWDGRTVEEIATRAGISKSTACQVQSGRQPSIAAAGAAAIADLYDAIAGQPGPSRTAAVKARRVGWAPTQAWEATDIDDPAARPWASAWDPDEATAFRGQGWGWKELGRLYGYSGNAIRERVLKHTDGHDPRPDTTADLEDLEATA